MSVVRILVVDDDAGIRKLLRDCLESASYEVCEADNCADARIKLAQTTFNIAMLDAAFSVENKGTEGTDLAKEIRENYDCGIMMVTGVLDRAQRLAIYEQAADAVIVKPFEADEILAYTRSVLRRYEGSHGHGRDLAINPIKPVARFGGWTLHTKRHQLRSPGGVWSAVPGGNFNLLLYLLEHPNDVRTREQILDMDRATNAGGSVIRPVDMRITRLRKLFSENDHPNNARLVQTIRNFGYMLVADVEWSEDDH